MFPYERKTLWTVILYQSNACAWYDMTSLIQTDQHILPSHLSQHHAEVTLHMCSSESCQQRAGSSFHTGFEASDVCHTDCLHAYILWHWLTQLNWYSVHFNPLFLSIRLLAFVSRLSACSSLFFLSTVFPPLFISLSEMCMCVHCLVIVTMSGN